MGKPNSYAATGEEFAWEAGRPEREGSRGQPEDQEHGRLGHLTSLGRHQEGVLLPIDQALPDDLARVVDPRRVRVAPSRLPELLRKDVPLDVVGAGEDHGPDTVA